MTELTEKLAVALALIPDKDMKPDHENDIVYSYPLRLAPLHAALIECVTALELTAKHYEHSAHDHNWAFYLNEKHKEALARLRECLGES